MEEYYSFNVQFSYFIMDDLLPVHSNAAFDLHVMLAFTCSPNLVPEK
jgi:hypothetical protein